MNISYNKTIEVRYTADVFVAGGGPAGIAAAISCARQGKKVFLAESFSAFGGAAVTMLVPGFSVFTDGVNFLSSGIGKEVYDRLKEEAYPRYKRYCPRSIPVETLKVIYDDMVSDSKVKYLFHSNVIDSVVEKGSIEYVICSCKGSIFAVKADIYIDCTGDGDLAYYSNADYEFGDKNGLVMAATLCGIWSGIDWDNVKLPDGRCLDKAFSDKVFTNEDRHHPGMWRIAQQTQNSQGLNNSDGIGGSNVGHIYGIDSTNSESLTEGIVKGRHQLKEYRKYYKEYLSGFENCELICSASYLGIRESRRITCDYRLTVDDFKSRASFEDEIGRYCYSIDIHSATNDKEGYDKFISEYTSLRYAKGESYGIPYRSLAVKGIANLLTAGRCICTDRYMQSSIRVMPGCFITGQAAGIAAAILCEDKEYDVHKADIKKIQKRLVSSGAYLPNYKV